VKVNFLQSKLSSIFLICPNHFNLFIFIDCTITFVHYDVFQV
jgi:hypothetical protein